MTQSLPPFSCTYTPEIPELLAGLGCSLVVSTYQAGKVIIFSPNPDGQGLNQLPRNFPQAMGLAVSGPLLAIATRHEVVVLANAPGLARDYPHKPGWYDGLYAPRAVYMAGELDLHDMAWSGESLWAVNTRFSCLCQIDHRYSFTPRWQPPFIRELTPHDHCHLNGMAMAEGQPRYVTALGQSDTPKGWRPTKLSGGVLLDVPSGEIILRDLPMPHSPRLFDGRLYLLLSATGELVTVDLAAGRYETVNRMPGFVRGLARCGDYLFAGLSRLRPNHTFGDLPLAKQPLFCGIVVIHLPSGRLAGSIRYLNSCEEIYDVQVLPGLRRPGILGLDHDLHRRTLATPSHVFWGQPVDPAGPPPSGGPSPDEPG